MSDEFREVGPNDDEIGLTIDGGSQSRDRNTGTARFSVDIVSDRELSHGERKTLLHRLIGTEFALKMEDDDE